MDLSIDDLRITYKETFTARSSWCNLGLALKVPVATLDDIDGRSRDPKDLLREVLKVWLKRAHRPTWQSLVDALDNPIVDEPRLARALQEKYCTEPTNPMQLLQEQVVADTEATAALKEAYLQQERKLEDLQGTVAAWGFQIQEFEEQASEQKMIRQDTITAQGLQLHEMVEKVREKKAQQQEEVTSDPSCATVAEGGLRLKWTVEESAPVRMERGQAVVDGSTASSGPATASTCVSESENPQSGLFSQATSFVLPTRPDNEAPTLESFEEHISATAITLDSLPNGHGRSISSQSNDASQFSQSKTSRKTRPMHVLVQSKPQASSGVSGGIANVPSGSQQQSGQKSSSTNSFAQTDSIPYSPGSSQMNIPVDDFLMPLSGNAPAHTSRSNAEQPRGFDENRMNGNHHVSGNGFVSHSQNQETVSQSSTDV